MAQATARIDGQYVLAVARTDSHYAVLSSGPGNTVSLLDCKTLARSAAIANARVGQGTTALRVVDSMGPRTAAGRKMVLLASRDGTVALWDDRQADLALTMSHASAAAGVLSVDALPARNMIAAGTALNGEDASILYWDPRAPGAPLHSHTSTHSDDITVLHFRNETDGPVLLSASTDGLVSTSNPLEQDEDNATLNVANYVSSIAHAGWTASGHVWASSDMETGAIWDSNLDLVHDFGDLRAREIPNFKPNYLIDGFAWGGELCLALGSNEGEAAVVSLVPGQPETWTPRLHVRGGAHSEIVRCALWDAQAGVMVTGGEDSVVAVWGADALRDVPDVPMEEDQSRRKRTRDEENGSESKRKRI
ncbi:WD40 repeat-like protein [Auricularia subglabra TFB-10046 SS5]|nr:WD40 repeat-like protein [Auricularia subglabra TFB-10046 SS5]